MENNEARVNVTWADENADMPDPVSFDLSDAQVLQIVTEAVQSGFPGILADPDANFAGYVVDRFAANEAVPYNRFIVRPKTSYGV